MFYLILHQRKENTRNGTHASVKPFPFRGTGGRGKKESFTACARALQSKHYDKNFSLEMETFNMLLLEYPQLMYGGVGATAFLAGGALIYKIASR